MDRNIHNFWVERVWEHKIIILSYFDLKSIGGLNRTERLCQEDLFSLPVLSWHNISLLLPSDLHWYWNWHHWFSWFSGLQTQTGTILSVILHLQLPEGRYWDFHLKNYVCVCKIDPWTTWAWTAQYTYTLISGFISVNMYHSTTQFLIACICGCETVDVEGWLWSFMQIFDCTQDWCP